MSLIDKNVPLVSEKAEDQFNKAIGLAIKAEDISKRPMRYTMSLYCKSS